MKIFGLWAAIALLFSAALITTPAQAATPRPCPEITSLTYVSYASSAISMNSLRWTVPYRTPYNQAYNVERSDDAGATWQLSSVTTMASYFTSMPTNVNTLFRVYAVTSAKAPCTGITTPRVFNPTDIGDGVLYGVTRY